MDLYQYSGLVLAPGFLLIAVSILYAFSKRVLPIPWIRTSLLIMSTCLIGATVQMWVYYAPYTRNPFMKAQGLFVLLCFLSFILDVLKLTPLKTKNKRKMSMRKVGFFLDSLNDEILQIDNNPASTIVSAGTLPTMDSRFFLEMNDDGENLLCMDADASAPQVELLVRRANSSEYTAISADFVGGRPPRRPI